MARNAPLHPLKKWRLSKGFTLEKAAALVGTSRQVWFGWESGRRRPSPTFMPKVRAATDGQVSADDFFCEQIPALGKAA